METEQVTLANCQRNEDTLYDRFILGLLCWTTSFG